MYYLGIDFGAQNIMVQCLKPDNNRLVVLFKDKDVLPNVYATSMNGQEYFGWDAIQLQQQPEKIASYFEHYKIDLLNSDQKSNNAYSNGVTPVVLVEKMLTFVIQHSLDYINTHEGLHKNTLQQVVITLPAGWEKSYFLAIYESAYQKACQACNINASLRLISEPAAAMIPLVKRFRERMQPGEALVCAVLDIGASTTDVSICKYTLDAEGIELLGANSMNKAGRHFDTLIARHLGDPADITTLQDAEDLKKSAADIVPGPFRRLMQFFKEKIDDRRLKELARGFAGECASLVNTTLSQLTPQVTPSYLLVCGGMSALRFDFDKSLLNEITAFLPDCTIPGFNCDDIHDDTLKRRAICYGAAQFAKEPNLIKDRLGFDIRAVLYQAGRQEPHYPLILDAQTELNGQQIEVSICNVIREKFGVGNFAFSERDNELQIVVAKPGLSKMYQIGVAIEGNLEQEVGQFEDQPIVEVDRFDAIFIICGDGALHIKVKSLNRNTIVATGKLVDIRQTYANPNGLWLGNAAGVV